MEFKSLSFFGKSLSAIAILFTFAISPAGAVLTHAVTPRPCDLYASATPCVAAFSTSRALYSAYSGPLYQVTRQSDKASADVGLLPDGYAKAETQDKFCASAFLHHHQAL